MMKPGAVVEARVSLGMSQRQLARALGVSRSSVTRWEEEGTDRRINSLAIASLLIMAGRLETARALVYRQLELEGVLD